VEWAMKVLDQMGKYGCSPNVTKYNELLDGLFNANRIQEALRIVGEIEEMEIELNLVTYKSGFCHAGMLKDALQLVGKMLVGGTKPDAITYNTVIYAYCEQGEVKTAVQLVDRLTEERGIQTYLHALVFWGVLQLDWSR
jgi:pentatricopeptide repeat protein